MWRGVGWGGVGWGGGTWGGLVAGGGGRGSGAWHGLRVGVASGPRRSTRQGPSRAARQGPPARHEPPPHVTARPRPSRSVRAAHGLRRGAGDTGRDGCQQTADSSKASSIAPAAARRPRRRCPPSMATAPLPPERDAALPCPCSRIDSPALHHTGEGLPCGGSTGGQDEPRTSAMARDAHWRDCCQ